MKKPAIGRVSLPANNLSDGAAIGLLLLMIVQIVLALGLPVLVVFALLRYLGAC